MSGREIATTDTADVAAAIGRAVAALAAMDEIEDVRQVVGQAEGWQHLFQRIGETQERQNACAELKLRAIRRAGEILSTLREPGAKMGQGRYVVPDGMNPDMAMRWRKAAAVPDDEFQRYIDRGKSNGTDLSVMGLLRYVPKQEGTRGFAYDDATKDRARELRDEGLNYAQIADALGIRSQTTVKLWLDARYRERHGAALRVQKRRRSRAASAKARQRLAGDLRRAGDPLGEVEPHLRRLLAALQTAADATDVPSERARRDDLFGFAYALEDALGRVMRGHTARGTNERNPE